PSPRSQNRELAGPSPGLFSYLPYMPSLRQRQRPASPSKDLTVSDAERLTRCRAGDVDAFETLYRQHAGRIFALASRLAGSIDQGEDLLQEIFLQAYRKLDSFKGESALGTWLYRLAVNHCLDFVRSRQA